MYSLVPGLGMRLVNVLTCLIWNICTCVFILVQCVHIQMQTNLDQQASRITCILLLHLTMSKQNSRATMILVLTAGSPHINPRSQAFIAS